MSEQLGDRRTSRGCLGQLQPGPGTIPAEVRPHRLAGWAGEAQCVLSETGVVRRAEKGGPELDRHLGADAGRGVTCDLHRFRPSGAAVHLDLKSPAAALDPERASRCDRGAGHHSQTVTDSTPRWPPQELGRGEGTIDREQGGDPRCVHAGAIVGHRPGVLVDLLEGDVGGVIETIVGKFLQGQRADLIRSAPRFLWEAVRVKEQRKVAADEGHLLDLGGDLLPGPVPADALGRGRRYLGVDVGRGVT